MTCEKDGGRELVRVPRAGYVTGNVTGHGPNRRGSAAQTLARPEYRTKQWCAKGSSAGLLRSKAAILFGKVDSLPPPSN